MTIQARGALKKTGLSVHPASAGHVATPRGHVCGEFKDEFDWSTLPKAYLTQIGWRAR